MICFVFLQPNDDIHLFLASYNKTKLPIMIVKGDEYADGESYISLGGKHVFEAGSEIMPAFFMYVKLFFFFNITCEPHLSNFFNFFWSSVLTISKPSTTVNNFFITLN